MRAKLSEVQLLHEAVQLHAMTAPDAIAVEFEHESQGWEEFDRRIRRTATMLRDQGIGQNSRVGIVAKNTPIILELLLGAGMLGASLTPVNWRLASPEIAHILEDSEIELLFVADEFAETVAAATNGPSALRQTISAELQGFRSLVDERTELEDATANTEDTVLILYSSGTTGRPKGVMISHRALLWRAKHGDASVPTPRSEEERSRMLVALPMFHIGALGSAVRMLALGHRVHLLREAKLPQMLEAIESGDDNAFLAPAVIQGILDDDGPLVSTVAKLRDLSYGSAPITPALIDRALAAWPATRISQGYGSTETVGSVSLLTDEHHRHRSSDRILQSVGAPVPGAELRIVDPETLTDVSTGEIGEIWVRAPFLTTGYYRNPEATAALFAEGGWLRTGDLGSLDEEGLLYIRDRLKDMIISGGENIYSLELEHALIAHPAVFAAAVVGIPDARWGERPIAFVELEKGASIASGELDTHMRSRLASFKCPDRYIEVDSLPRNSAGKILKPLLRERAIVNA